ncbi:transcriptional regulator, TetR family [Andreprevotia lacus DSM 23236]|jgi:TetR/AcrR family transcriptional repressor of nem operon|uniref:Transcriptional regulator, TetR family n=1 Tax=Andreprevotia lacus DSM 23236 TaxID=1121001 RepID=A0A1W1XVZ0_9NEIS|nr:TetR/AcrR family transcriptional regulator [Andreprevotia lacus]SMC28047.1 transcriptional regulator, TetR family [Andreprevotia lacus DSM 23236]
MNKRTQDTRDHLLATGAAIMLGKGFAAVGLTEILSTAGVPKGSFYHYFESKEGYGVALLQRYFDDYLAEVDRLLANREFNGRAKLDAYFDAWQPHGEEGELATSRCLAVKLSGEVCDLSADMRTTLQRGMAQAVERLAAFILIGRADGSVPQGGDAGQLAAALYQLWLGAALASKVQHSTQPYAAARLATAALLDPRSN